MDSRKIVLFTFVRYMSERCVTRNSRYVIEGLFGLQTRHQTHCMVINLWSQSNQELFRRPSRNHCFYRPFKVIKSFYSLFASWPPNRFEKPLSQKDECTERNVGGQVVCLKNGKCTKCQRCFLKADTLFSWICLSDFCHLIRLAELGLLTN